MKFGICPAIAFIASFDAFLVACECPASYAGNSIFILSNNVHAAISSISFPSSGYFSLYFPTRAFHSSDFAAPLSATDFL